jgi:hypothetical protein
VRTVIRIGDIVGPWHPVPIAIARSGDHRYTRKAVVGNQLAKCIAVNALSAGGHGRHTSDFMKCLLGHEGGTRTCIDGAQQFRGLPTREHSTGVSEQHIGIDEYVHTEVLDS